MIFVFRWQATDESGLRRSGATKGFSEDEVRRQLKEQSFRTIVITSQTFVLADMLRPKIKVAHIVAFARSLKTMAAAGMVLADAVEILAQQEEDKELEKVLSSLQNDLVGGTAFSHAIASYPTVFNPFFISLASAGESSGKLPLALEKIAKQLEDGDKLARKIKTAMSYPVAVLCIALGLVFVMLLFVIPSFEKMFGTTPLPLPTRILIGISDFFEAYWLFSLLGLGIMAWLLTYIASTANGKRVLDGMILKLPLFGSLIKKSAVARTTRAMSLMTASGMLAVNALNIVATTINNVVIRDTLLNATKDVVGGKSIAEPLRETGIFSPMAIGLIAVGETTKALPDTLGIIADFYENEINNIAESVSGLVEPVMTVVVGIIVGGMLLALYLPIFSVVSNVG
ncbi:MAG: type II secretion system F family protein [Deltaproteobacteria bacterium]|nr:type II secretion system F family protein [Deltaproteobacteria bacterium]